jgi:hypothetical protein
MFNKIGRFGQGTVIPQTPGIQVPRSKIR